MFAQETNKKKTGLTKYQRQNIKGRRQHFQKFKPIPKDHLGDIEFMDWVYESYQGSGGKSHITFNKIEAAFFEYLSVLGNQGLPFKADRLDFEQMREILDNKYYRSANERLISAA